MNFEVISQLGKQTTLPVLKSSAIAELSGAQMSFIIRKKVQMRNMYFTTSIQGLETSTSTNLLTSCKYWIPSHQKQELVFFFFFFDLSMYYVWKTFSATE